MIGKPLGHRKVRTTARHAHPVRDPVKASAVLAARSIGADMAAGTPKSDAACS